MPAAIALDSAWLAAVLLLSLRLAAVFLMTPILAAASVPSTVRVLLVLGLSAALVSALPSAVAPAGALGGPEPLLRAGLTELALGATLALGILLAFSAASMAGELLGVQIGFGLGAAIDPSSNRAVPLLASAYGQLAVVLFFLVNGHHALLRGIAYSLARFPLGQPWRLEAALGPTLRQVAGLFTLGFALAAPIVISILLVDMALGVVARHLPQLNMLTLGVPIKIVVGLVALSLWFGRIGGVMTRVYEAIYRSWDQTFEARSAPIPLPPPLPAPAARGGPRPA
jgi:flagellar biosynthetic protein FliR